jgi:hypothetical protein
MNKRLSMKVIFVAAACAILLFLGNDAMAASKNCSLIGSWFGAAGDNTWFTIASRGSSATAGQLYVQWTRYLLTPPDVRVSDWVGGWQKVDKDLYKWTAVFYTYDASGAITTTNRLSGTSDLVNCDQAEDTWVWEVWLSDSDMSTDPDICHSGTGTETRMPVLEVVCE